MVKAETRGEDAIRYLRQEVLKLRVLLELSALKIKRLESQTAKPLVSVKTAQHLPVKTGKAGKRFDGEARKLAAGRDHRNLHGAAGSR